VTVWAELDEGGDMALSMATIVLSSRLRVLESSVTADPLPLVDRVLHRAPLSTLAPFPVHSTLVASARVVAVTDPSIEIAFSSADMADCRSPDEESAILGTVYITIKTTARNNMENMTK